ncbi:hypothetical protein BDK51DRAFT_52764 [Blyttiomyces helicus]|uniref:Uncharacterized protein n=1 Tax=Blyttiomyces helicus TaxID=388810 RepID=A0A4P9W221_9FUNG|nr:hypothetical protein BDK51DRAFT_52764 [Blyttiomyces helicus]|eukprot:RKO86251.1 hypothetical protein BDK51DRAFT_52764 [Blyttiomyces helicus]
MLTITLRPSLARTTIIQGMTLDRVEIDLSRVFTFGQAYVGISRIRDLDNLRITGVDKETQVFQADERVVDFYNSLREVDAQGDDVKSS